MGLFGEKKTMSEKNKSTTGFLGGIKAPRRRKEALLKDFQRKEAGLLGDSSSVQQDTREAAMQDAGALIQANKLGGMPGQKFDAGLGKVIAQAGAAGGAQAAKLSQNKALTESAEIDAALERQQDRTRQNVQFWTNLLFSAGTGGMFQAGKQALDFMKKSKDGAMDSVGAGNASGGGAASGGGGGAG